MHAEWPRGQCHQPKAHDNPSPNVWSTYQASDDLDRTVAKANAAGSQFMMEPVDVMSAGGLAFAMDPRGSRYGIWQAGDHKGVGSTTSRVPWSGTS